MYSIKNNLAQYSMKSTLYYIHDPMCSWCWGFSKSLSTLLEQLPAGVQIRRLLGGLAPDSGEPMPDTMRQAIKDNWLRIEETIPGVKFNFDFWQKVKPRRSTYPACRAVISARLQGEENDLKMIQAIQRAYYQQARNPSDILTLIELAEELNLSVQKFHDDLLSTEVDNILKEEIDLSRALYAESFPSLVLTLADSNETSAITINYNDSDKMLNEVKNKLQSR